MHGFNIKVNENCTNYNNYLTNRLKCKMSSLIFSLATLSIVHSVSSFPFTATTATPQSHHKLLQFIENQRLTNIHNLQYTNVTELYVRVLELSQTLNILQESLVCNLYTYCNIVCTIMLVIYYYRRVTGLVMMLLWYLLTVSFQREQQMIVLVMWRYVYTNTHKATIAVLLSTTHQ